MWGWCLGSKDKRGPTRLFFIGSLFTFLAQLVRAFTLSSIVWTRSWVVTGGVFLGAFPSPPRYLGYFVFIAHRVQHSHVFSLVLVDLRPISNVKRNIDTRAARAAGLQCVRTARQAASCATHARQGDDGLLLHAKQDFFIDAWQQIARYEYTGVFVVFWSLYSD